MRGWIACATSALLLSCGAKENATVPQLGDCTGPGCAGRIGGGGTRADGSADASQASSVDAGAVTVSFTIGQTGPTFEGTVTYAKPVIVSALDPSANFVSTSEMGVTSAGTLGGVASGPNWFAIQDVAATTGSIIPTLEPVTVEPASPVAFRAIPREPLTPALIDNMPWAPLAGTATLILIFVRNDVPLSGVSVTSQPGGAAVAYDSGDASYTTPEMDPFKTTDVRGAAIVRDVPLTQAFPVSTQVSIEYKVNASTVQRLESRVAKDFVTFETIQVP